jgi:aryl-alcohol dehydrogenase-like predicted oxidoreductase
MTSKLALGTAQFGMQYGIANMTGIPSMAAVHNILSSAREAGVSIIDTAYVYGGAEIVLGRAISGSDRFRIVTKTMPIQAPVLREEHVAAVADAFACSLERLQCRHVYGLLVHHAEDLLVPGGERLWAWLESIRAAGKVEKIGVSVYRPEQLISVVDSCPIDLVQFPYNLYDQRFGSAELMLVLRRHNIEAHARSVFLQGLLLLAPERLTGQFASLREHQARLHAWLAERDMSPVQGALSCTLHAPGISFAIVGCDSIQQFAEVINCARRIRSLEDVGQFSVHDDEIINPSRWN